MPRSAATGAKTALSMQAQERRAEAAQARRSETIDLAQLERATFGDQALARDVLSLFSERAETLLADIVDARDARSRRDAAHSLKGAALGVGAVAVAEAAAELEAVAGDPHAFPGAIVHLATLVAVARLAIAGLLMRD